MKKVEGAIVDEPQVGSPAAKVGILAGDVITAVDGKDVKDAHGLARRIAAMAPGTLIKLGMLHNGQEKTVSLTLGQLPDQRQARAGPRSTAESGSPQLGLTLAPASDGNRGVVVTAVDPNGPAADRGVKEGDVILDIAGKAVSDPADVRQQLTDLRKEGRHAALMRMKSGDSTKFVAVPLGSA
jgi:serine protease Do